MNNEIYITITPNRMGHLHLSPAFPSDQKRIGDTNYHDGSYDVYLQNDVDIKEFLNFLSDEDREQVNKGWTISVYYDEWTYRHLVGGVVET